MVEKKIKILLIILSFLLVGNFTFSQEVSWRELTNQAYKFYKEGRYKEAAEVTKKALKIAEQKFGSESLQAAESLGNLAALYRLQGKDSEAEPLFKRAREIRAKHGMRGIPLGIQTEVYFDEVAKGKGENIERARRQGFPDTPQMASNRQDCDLDEDGDCDGDDFMVFKASLGKCHQDFHTTSDVLADVDGDGCITLTDQGYLFPDELGGEESE